MISLKLPSRHTSIGPSSAPHRSYYYAMGMTTEEINQPFVGVVSTWNESAPCNITLKDVKLKQSKKVFLNLKVHQESLLLLQ